MSKRKRDEWVDDGRIIANMDVDGMPYTFRRGARRNRDAFGQKKIKSEPIELTKKEKRSISWGAASAYVLVAVVFISVFGLFLLFCSKVWFR
ncbi:MAG: hypothetical protein GX417_01320 [Clostridiales bacterium]|nr:hypothetical protein [Clostridiales bacterium]